MKNLMIKIIAFSLLAILPFSLLVAFTEKLPNQYRETYLAAFEDKYQRLYQTEGKKIVFIGGSSLPFGLRSDLIQQELGNEYTVVNFGLYASLGTKFMMDTAKDAIDEGDIIILCPELNEQTYSLYFNPEATLQATDGFSAMLSGVPLDNKLSLFYNYYKFAFEKIAYFKKQNAPSPIGIYRADSFNEYGDISVERENNIINNAVDENMLVVTDSNLLDPAFIAYVNDFTHYAEEKGATVYFNYSPVNASAIRSSKVARAEFEKTLRELLDCELLGSIENCLIDERYFYDTNFHLNSAGAVYFSRTISLSLKEKLGLPLATSLEIPAPPELPVEEVATVDPNSEKVAFEDYRGEPNNDYLECFTYTLVGSSYKITGVHEEYLNMTEVILPSVYDGKNITAIAEDAFIGCEKLKRIHIGTTYKSLEVRSFNGCTALEGIYLYAMDGNKMTPAATGLLDGTAEGATIRIPEGSNYMTGYTWSNYASKIKTFTIED